MQNSLANNLIDGTLTIAVPQERHRVLVSLRIGTACDRSRELLAQAGTYPLLRELNHRFDSRNSWSFVDISHRQWRTHQESDRLVSFADGVDQRFGVRQ
ncbi:hypothetical protein [Pyxidicoccus parkwayensis]|uniref:hypothetical protein n=1 Tax=Pyxidicoccus parkwayensis TaxID=2813578 RepID=UPI001F512E40|nr:hypothetical protein [Pyxidicoccus parkwaysis]